MAHSHRRTGRRFDPDIQTGHYESDGRRVRLRPSADAIRAIDRMATTSKIAANERRKVTRVRNHDVAAGRPRGHLPGVTTSSW